MGSFQTLQMIWSLEKENQIFKTQAVSTEKQGSYKHHQGALPSPLPLPLSPAVQSLSLILS